MTLTGNRQRARGAAHRVQGVLCGEKKSATLVPRDAHQEIDEPRANSLGQQLPGRLFVELDAIDIDTYRRCQTFVRTSANWH